MLKRMIKLILLIIMLVTIFYFSHQSGSASQGLSDGLLYRILKIIVDEPYAYFTKVTLDFYSLILRKTAHFCEFGLLGILIAMNLEEYLNKQNRIYYSAVLLTIIYAISDEIHQYFIPNRSCMLIDVVIDSLGAIVIVYLYLKIKQCLIKE